MREHVVALCNHGVHAVIVCPPRDCVTSQHVSALGDRTKLVHASVPGYSVPCVSPHDFIVPWIEADDGSTLSDLRLKSQRQIESVRQ